mgnify:CR=1 FL=1
MQIIITSNFTRELQYHKACQRQLLTRGLVLLALILNFTSLAANAERTRLESVYFNSDSSIIIETESSLEMSLPKLIGDTYVVAINDSKLANDIPKQISTEQFEIELIKTKSANKNFWSFNNLVELRIKPKKQSRYEIQTRTVLEGLAYEFNIVEVADSSLVLNEVQDEEIFEDSLADDLVASLGLKKVETEEIHHLSAKIDTGKNHKANKGRLDKFVDKLDSQFVKVLQEDQNYQTESQEKQDSSALLHLADTLVIKGHLADGLKAYREALKLNPENHDAHLALANASTDQAEKINSYLASVDDDALMAISQNWFQQGQKSHDLKSIAKGLVAYQFAVLKNPQQAQYRFDYAKALEQSGPAFYEQAAKRYLEAAALAKKQYLAGLDSTELLLRDSTEALIHIHSLRGDFPLAAKYCNSYINLGFKKFQNGKAILAIMKEIEANRNPFKLELAYIGGSELD